RYALSLSSFSDYSLPLSHLHSFPTRRSSDLTWADCRKYTACITWLRPSTAYSIARTPARSEGCSARRWWALSKRMKAASPTQSRSEEHTSELQSPDHLVCRLLLEKKKKTKTQ